MAYGQPEIKFEEYGIKKAEVKKERDNYNITISSTGGVSLGCSIPIKDCEDDFQEKAKFWKRIFLLSYGLSLRLVMVDNGYADETVIILDRLGGAGKKFKDHYCNGKVETSLEMII